MKHILLYADSLSWGIIPTTRKRLNFDERWPGVMENELNKAAPGSVRIIEDCLNGRRTAWDDPYKAGRNGLETIQQRMEIHSPLDLVILFLGTNDFQAMHQLNAWSSSQGIAALINAIRQAPIEPGMPLPPILVIAPPPIGEPKGPIAPKFLEGNIKSAGLTEAIKRVADEMDCAFFDAGSVTTSSKVDGVHLDKDQHGTLGLALTKEVAALLK